MLLNYTICNFIWLGFLATETNQSQPKKTPTVCQHFSYKVRSLAWYSEHIL